MNEQLKENLAVRQLGSVTKVTERTRQQEQAAVATKEMQGSPGRQERPVPLLREKLLGARVAPSGGRIGNLSGKFLDQRTVHQ